VLFKWLIREGEREGADPMDLVDAPKVTAKVKGRKDDVQLARRTILIVLKGGDEHLIPVGRKAAAALDRYLRARAKSRYAASRGCGSAPGARTRPTSARPGSRT
jgi:hypothetical protein